MRRLTDRFADAAASSASLSELRLLLEEAVHDLGFDFFALLQHSGATNPGRFVRLDNYPEAWVQEWLASGFDRIDPVHQACGHQRSGFRWSDLPALVRLTSDQQDILKRCRDFGIGTGFTVPLALPGEPAASCSFAVRNARRVPRNRLACARQVSVDAFAAARRLLRLRRGARPT
jgi:Autoinducer binding domain